MPARRGARAAWFAPSSRSGWWYPWRGPPWELWRWELRRREPWRREPCGGSHGGGRHGGRRSWRQLAWALRTYSVRLGVTRKEISRRVHRSPHADAPGHGVESTASPLGSPGAWRWTASHPTPQQSRRRRQLPARPLWNRHYSRRSARKAASAASAEVITGRTSKSTRSSQWAVHCSISAGASVSMS